MSVSATQIELLLPVYNGARYLREAIDSVRAQTREDWHLLVIDDASSDQSRQLVESYQDPRIRLSCNARNVGLYASLVAAVEMAHREWLGILMQDDRLKPDYLHEMSRLMARYPAADGFWATEDLIDEGGRVTATGADTRRIEPIEPGVASWLSVLNRGCIWTISGSMTRRRLLTQSPFRVDLPHCGDYDWFLRAVRERQFVYYERPLLELRIHARQASALNLQSGRDLTESYRVLQLHVRTHAADLTTKAVWRIALGRAQMAGRRVAGRMLRGRFVAGVRLFVCLCQFLCLPVSLLGKTTSP